MEKQGIKKNEKCIYCGNYERYYVKGSQTFQRTNQGYCYQQKTIVDKNYYCECWKSRLSKINIRKRTISIKLNKILIDLEVIRQILQENQEEEKIYNEQFESN